MSTQATIESKIREALNPEHLEVINESYMHNVPPGSESHFKLFVVSEAFEGQKRVARQRVINKLLAEELKDKIHALSMHTFTPEEWHAQETTSLQSPRCRGGERKAG